jgi:hypothetical protein
MGRPFDALRLLRAGRQSRNAGWIRESSEEENGRLTGEKGIGSPNAVSTLLESRIKRAVRGK